MRAFRYLFSFLKYLTLGLLVFGCGVWLFMSFAPTFGGKPDAPSLKRISESQHYQNGQFVNLQPTQVSTQSEDSDSSLLDWIFPAADKNPMEPLPSRRLNQKDLIDQRFVWLGHSTIVFQTAGVVIMTDPVFNRASPIPIGGKSFAMQSRTSIADLPAINVVVISHDHYDHLDHQAIKQLDSRVELFYVPLGVKAHLLRWGIDGEKIFEFDWYQKARYRDVDFIFTPSRHFSGRGLDNRNSTLWGSWVVKSDSLSAYFSGDGGYSKTFKKLGEKFGPFDIAFMENGAYSLDWAEIHTLPEETVQASLDLKAKILFPIHWGKFDLALHPWDEPIKRLETEAKIRGVTVATPLIGEVFDLEIPPSFPWWQSMR